jgi:hypothetical protein
VAKGTIDFLPETFANVEAWLPRSVTIVSSETYGGAVRAVIQGNGIDDGASYQMVVTEEPMRRVIELVKSPFPNG